MGFDNKVHIHCAEDARDHLVFKWEEEASDGLLASVSVRGCSVTLDHEGLVALRGAVEEALSANTPRTLEHDT